jgi:uncharacterized coiled-coil DUF342 family protein
MLNRRPVFTALVCSLAFILATTAFNQRARADEPKHEKIDHARDSLSEAYKDLQKASDDFDGHKKEAMEKIDEANKSLEHWHAHVNEAIEKVDKALEQLHVCKDKGHERHEMIEKAIDALEAAKEELKE